MKSKSGDLVYQIQVEGFPDLSQLDQVNAVSTALPGAVGRIPITIPASPPPLGGITRYPTCNRESSGKNTGQAQLKQSIWTKYGIGF